MNQKIELNSAQMYEILKQSGQVFQRRESDEGECKHAVQILHDIFAQITGIKDSVQNESYHSQLESGIAFSPGLAAGCIEDSVRTTRFVRALIEAIQEAKRRFPGQKIHICYAGTGPYAPLALPVLPLFSPDEIKLTPIDLHRESGEALVRIIKAMGLESYVSGVQVGDASHYRHSPDDPIHILISENLQKALNREPQVSILRNFEDQMPEGGIMIPGRTSLDAYLVDSPHVRSFVEGKVSLDDTEKCLRLGEAFRLSRETLKKWGEDMGKENFATVRSIPGATLPVPEYEFASPYLVLVTVLELFEDIELKINESGLTTVEVYLNENTPPPGKQLKFDYLIDREPRLVHEVV